MQFSCSFIGKIAFWQWSHLRPFSDMDFWMRSWCPFGSLLAPFGLHIPPFWLRLASFWRPFASFSINSGSFWSFGHHITRRGATFCQHFRLRWHHLVPKWDVRCIGSQNNCSQPLDFHILGAFVGLDVLTTPSFLKIHLAATNFAEAPELNRQKPPSKELLLCRTPHPPGPLRNFAAGNLDKRRV